MSNNASLSSLLRSSPRNKLIVTTAIVVALICYLPAVIHLQDYSLPWSVQRGTTSFFINKVASSASSSDDMTVVTDAVSAATGKLFKGQQMRTFPREQRQFVQLTTLPSPLPTKSNHTVATNDMCDKWNVVTTIFAPSEAIKRAAKVIGWCTVIVADTKTPQDYMEQAGFLQMEETVHYLSVKDQEAWLERETARASAVASFLKAIPYRSFARKNIGFLYAIQQGATFLFDFDDDNLLPLDSQGNVRSALQAANIEDGHEDSLPNTRVVSSKTVAFNHHPLMGATVPNSWARGFPLQDIQNKLTHGEVINDSKDIDMKSVAVMQFCANGNPDIDAIHRLVHPLPMNFESSKTPHPLQPLSIPSNTYIPYNAQATLHTRQAMWALYLPFTVTGRVSDIWRGYFAETLFRDVGLSMTILPPVIEQERNEHNYLADMQAELDLYFKSGVLIDYLSKWQSSAKIIPERMEELWIDLYERSYIDINDVKVIQFWLAALMEVGYEFPQPKR